MMQFNVNLGWHLHIIVLVGIPLFSSYCGFIPSVKGTPMLFALVWDQ